MDAGLIAQLYRLQFTVDATVSIDSGMMVDAAGGYLVTKYDDAVAGPSDGFVLASICIPNGADVDRYYSCVIGSLFVNWTRTEASAGDGSLSSHVDFENLRIYTLPTGGFDAVFDDIKWYTDSTLRQSFGAGSVTNFKLTPSAIPLLGCLGADLLAEIKADMAYIATSTIEGTATVEATKGWRFKVLSTDDWETLPVTVSVSNGDFPSATSCDVGAPDLGSLPSATTTYNGSVHARLEVDSGATNPRYADEYHGQVTLLPNLTREIIRVNDNYGALWFRGGFPECEKTGTWVCQEYDELGEPSDSTTDSTTSTVHDEEMIMLSMVTNSSHTIEEPLSATCYAPFYHAAMKQKSSGGTMLGLQSRVAGFPSIVADTDVLGYFKSTSDNIEYANTWGNPHWSYLYHFQNWEVDGSPVGADDYFNPAHSQYLHNSTLPSAEDTNQRNFICESPLIDGGFSDWIQTYLYANSKTHWVGIPRFHIIEPDVPTSFTLDSDSEDAWTPTDCTLSFGSTITITPSAGTIIVEQDIGRFDCPPFQSLHQCDRIKPNWQTTNVTAVRVYLVSADGATKKLLEQTAGDGYTTRNVTYSIPVSTDTKYAGSHAQDNGVGSVDDIGTDLKANGQSATVCADAERVHSFNLLGGRTYTKVRYEFDCSGNVTLEYPVFYTSSSEVTILQENGHHANLLWPNGPGLRIGQWQWWDGSSLNVTPDVLPLGSAFVFGYRMSALDALCTKRELFEGIDRDDGLLTEIATIYDSVEGQTRAKVDSFTNAFILPPGDTSGGSVGLIALVNSFSAIPPIGAFPRKTRDADWGETGDYAQVSYSYCQLPRYLVANKQIDLYNGVDKWTTLSSVTVAGWVITEHSHETDNTETCTIVDASGAIAEVRPWWGWFFICGETAYGTSIANCHNVDGMFWMAYLVDGDIFVKRANYGNPRGGWDYTSQVTTSGDCSDLGLSYTPGLLELVYTRDGDSCRRLSNDLGMTWRSEETIAGGMLNRNTSNKYGDRITGYFAYDSGTSGPGKIFISRKLRGDTAWSTPAAILNSAGTSLSVTSDGFDISYGYVNGRWILTATKDGDTEPTNFISFDFLASVREC